MSTDLSCIFCKLAAGFIPSHKIYEDDIVFAFLDISPIVRGHTLVIPKAHYPTVMEIPPDALAAINARLPRLARAVVAAVNATGCHILVNNGPDAMQTVPHLHYHILPRTKDDGFTIPWPSKSLDPATAAPLVAAITHSLKDLA